MPPRLKKITARFTLAMMLGLQAHVIFHVVEDLRRHGQAAQHDDDDDCQICSTALAQKLVDSVELPRLTPVFLPFAALPGIEPRPFLHEFYELPCLRGPPADLSA
jgi:hypothetical protein